MKVQNSNVSFNGSFMVHSKKAAKYLTNLLPSDYQNRVLNEQESKEVKAIFGNFYEEMSKLAKSFESNKDTRNMDIVLIEKADLESGTYARTPAFLFTKNIETIKTKYAYDFLPGKDEVIDSLAKTKGKLDIILAKAKQWVEELKITNVTKKVDTQNNAEEIVQGIFKY